MLELNSTYYQLQALSSVMGMLRKVPHEFVGALAQGAFHQVERYRLTRMRGERAS
jgi:hypothetical protein